MRMRLMRLISDRRTVSRSHESYDKNRRRMDVDEVSLGGRGRRRIPGEDTPEQRF